MVVEVSRVSCIHLNAQPQARCLQSALNYWNLYLGTSGASICCVWRANCSGVLWQAPRVVLANCDECDWRKTYVILSCCLGSFLTKNLVDLVYWSLSSTTWQCKHSAECVTVCCLGSDAPWCVSVPEQALVFGASYSSGVQEGASSFSYCYLCKSLLFPF